VTAAAVIALIGSIGLALFGLLALLGSAVLNQPGVRDQIARQPTPPPISPFAMMTVMGVMMLGGAAWGCASGIAVLQLRRWARLSFVIFGGIAAALGAMNVIGSIFSMVMFSVMPMPGQDVPRGFLIGMMVVMGFVFLAVGALGVWWLILFNRADVKALFVGTSAAPERPAIPLRVLVIAWLMVAPVLVIPFLLTTRIPMPAILFGLEIRGWLAPVVLVMQVGVAVAAGVGLLRRRVAAHTVAVVFYIFGVINLAVLTVMPGAFRRAIELYQSASAAPPFAIELFDSMTPLVLGGSLLFNIVFVALLISARQPYLRACAPMPSAN
jgi:hypothetical protein